MLKFALERCNMKVNNYLDEIFFGNGDKKYLEILRAFAGNDEAEIFGVYDNPMDDSVRVLLTMPESEQKGSPLNLFVGDTFGDYARVGHKIFSRDEVLAVYGMVMSNYDLLQLVARKSVEESASDLDKYLKVHTSGLGKEAKEEKPEKVNMVVMAKPLEKFR